jgi:hypothetical protein
MIDRSLMAAEAFQTLSLLGTGGSCGNSYHVPVNDNHPSFARRPRHRNRERREGPISCPN